VLTHLSPERAFGVEVRSVREGRDHGE
jgi:hypothetical protein